VATFSTSALSVGDHNVTAVYSGDPSFAPSTSAVVVQRVVQDLPALDPRNLVALALILAAAGALFLRR
jgi:hypothetical protein